MHLLRIIPRALRPASLFALLAVLQLAVVSVQGQVAAQYRAAAQAYRDAAAKTKSARNRSCYQAKANYYDCLAAQMGPNGPRNCSDSSCTFEPEPEGATGGSTAPVNTQPTTAEDPSRTLQEIFDRNARDRQVAEEERREREEASNLQPVEMSPGGNNLIKDLAAGADAASRLGLSGTKQPGAESDGAAFDDLFNNLQSDADRAEAFALSSEQTDFTNREEHLLGDKTDHFYRSGDPRLMDLYTPGATGEPEGWGIPEFNPRTIDEFPTSITFGPEGMTEVQYQDRFAIPKSIEFHNDGKSVIEYGSDANYSAGVSITFERGHVTEVRGPLDNRVPTVITYDNSGRVVGTEHGPPIQAGPTLPAGGSHLPTPSSKRLTENVQKEPPVGFVSEKSPKASQPVRRDDGQIEATEAPGWTDKARGWIRHQKERFNRARDDAKQWWHQNVTRPYENLQQCASDPFECVTQLGQATK